ncbi:2-oxoglutarate dehydrogenase E1 component [Pelomonas sp. P7]|uniref:oxoglutarate dehydrogenase (succinyl-transferring) n=1 Tax=Pelomonas caseinilytica TaxID=2906763 RepID=A0ABS8XA90_9BURK|nr:2-oxoglutarate dehydrogenase E1 component [Pelomonas sp. P7]MCE4536573.1 2-oxoglutarate dehydrogenase E1 component [Pelomonas sp. P7]
MDMADRPAERLPAPGLDRAPIHAVHTHASPAARLHPAVERWIAAHRAEGHRCATLDPLGVADSVDARELLAPSAFGLAGSDELGPGAPAVLGANDVAALDHRLKRIYCGALALDSSALRDPTRRAWLHARLEALPPARSSTALLDRLIQAEAWEQFVAGRFPAAKRFSLQGCEALLPLLDALVEQAALQGVGELFMGMPHRGRVNVLVNLLGMAPARVLDHFDPDAPRPERHRDLVYHLGAQRSFATAHGPLKLTLAPNPSHLQSVFPVVLGMTYAAQQRSRAAALVVHGDAAFAGQGVVMEALMLSQRSGYAVGGCVHVIVNNQLGFTAPNPMDAAAARYCTDIARCIDAPVLRVNADAPERLAHAATLAMAYRARFGADVVIDLIGYRRNGHSEHDEPSLTSPRLYPMAAQRASVVESQGAALVAEGHCGLADMARHIERQRAAAQRAFAIADPGAAAEEAGAARERVAESAGPTRAALQAWVSAMTRLPRGFAPHQRIAELAAQWQRVAAGDASARADWCFAENMAYASLLEAGVGVRVSGMDVERGTFMHRHAVWHNQALAGPDEFLPLRQLGALAPFEVVNSPLSEEAVLGFEYGHSVQRPADLTVWEAQYGDFVNGAQVYVDQYIASGEEKWGQRSALTVLLPHGYEGVGPEHSNAFLSRFLQLCGAGNLRVACPSTAAQWYHLLRRQALGAERKPLIVMTPKAALHQDAASHSPLDALLQGRFEPVLDDDGTLPDEVRHLVLCSGKLHHELARARAAQPEAAAGVALVRLEQLYPFPQAELAAVLARYPRLARLTWAQEETLNQGAWHFVRDDLAALAPGGLAWRPEARAVTAAGACSSQAVHRREQAALIARALAG